MQDLQEASFIIEAHISIIGAHAIYHSCSPIFSHIGPSNNVQEPELIDSATILPVHLGSASESESRSITIRAFTASVELSGACP